MWNLLWKEWHEQSWKLGSGCVVLSALALIGLRARIVPDETMVMVVCFVGMTLLPVLTAASLLPAERSEGSFESLVALPVTPWCILAAKTLAGVVLCGGPIVCAGMVSLVAAGGRELTSAAMLDLYCRSCLAAVSLFIWMLAVTVQLPSEGRGALLSIGVLVFWALAAMGLAYPSVPQAALAIAPFSFVYGFSTAYVSAPPISLIALIQLPIAAALWFWTASRLVGPIEEGSQ